MTYGQVAARLGLVPGASRAVGSVNGSTPSRSSCRATASSAPTAP
ncbi:MAG: MGMT family protein [Nocardioidaceae bacterium]